MKNFLFSLFALLMISVSSLAQTIKVNGTVMDKTFDESVIGARVMEVGTQNGTVTDIDGKFTLTVKKGAKISISCVGYATQELEAKEEMYIEMGEDSKLMEEMVVTGYQVQRKADLTGAVSVVDTKVLKNTSDPDPIRALQGRVPGMTITSDGSPMGTGTIRIRGIGSFNASNAPLLVIDGMPTTQTLNSLNTADIESMQVLKDAASASIYGSRAANGVIIITTKKGKEAESKVKIDFNANWTAQFYSKQSQMNLLNTDEYATAMIQAALNDGKDPYEYAKNYGLNIYAPVGRRVSAYDPATGKTNTYTINGFYDGYINAKQTMRAADTDWLDAISRVGFIQNYDVTLSRGSEKGTSLVSVGYKGNDGILKHTDFKNVSARLNNTYNINKYLTVGENATITYTTQVGGGPMEAALKMAPTVPLFEKDGTTYSGPVGGMSDRDNPLRILDWEKDNNLNIYRIFGNAYADIKPYKGLVLHTSLGIDYDAANAHRIFKTYHSDIVNKDIPAAEVTQANDMRWNWTTTANYNVDIAEVHHLTALLGYEMYKDTRVDMKAYAEGYAQETLNYMWPDAATGTERGEGIRNGYALMSFFGKVDYNWDDRLLASFTLRRDGSSRFGENHKYGTFPAASLGYRLSRDIKGVESWLDDLKIRLSYGQTGNQDISNYARYNMYSSNYGGGREMSTAYDINLQGSGIFPNGYVTTQGGNANLKWETTTQYNVGLDFGFLKNRLFGTIDVYVKNITDMLISPAYLGSMGEGGASWANGPSLRNNGAEFLVGWRDNLKCGFGYKLTANADFFRNHVTSLPETAKGSYVHTDTQDIVQSGKPFGSRVGYVVAGLFQSKDEVLSYGQENARVGGLKYADLNGDGRITSADRTWIFNPVPAFSWGLNGEFTYKDFDLSIFLQGVAGVDVWNDQKYQTDFWSLADAGSNKGSRLLGAWNVNNTSSTIPALTTETSSDEGRESTYFVENGSYCKLRSLQFGYNLPQNIVQKAHLERVRIYASGQNLFTIKSKSLTCTDPENPSFAYPHTTSFSFGVQVGM